MKKVTLLCVLLLIGLAELKTLSSLRAQEQVDLNQPLVSKPAPVEEVKLSKNLLRPFEIEVFFDDLICLSLALILGGLIGAERQISGQSAGLRTHVMVAMGAAVFTLIGLSTFGDGQVTRVVQGIASGVGFIGAGAILRAGGAERVRGITTASSIWVSAALGAAAGLGELALAAAAGCVAIFVLFVLRPASNWLSRRETPREVSSKN